MKVYRRIRDLREDAGLKQEDMAEKLHVRQSTYSNYELGVNEIPIRALVFLADFYNTSIDYLLERTDVKEPLPKSKNNPL